MSTEKADQLFASRRWLLPARFGWAICLGLNALMASDWAIESLQLERETQAKPDSKNAIKLPDWWSPDDPLPVEKTNCVRCHLTAGRELTVPVRDFARSAHDRAKLSCNDCHGGNIDDDAKAHEAEFDFIGTKLSAHMATCAECHVEEAEAFRKGPHF
ncbi:MAG: hypothetical protein HY000_26415, partial [Planctomycetes bacterium]|nr:hypothetical protein [Planctomycetota bacterium]